MMKIISNILKFIKINNFKLFFKRRIDTLKFNILLLKNKILKFFYLLNIYKIILLILSIFIIFYICFNFSKLKILTSSLKEVRDNYSLLTNKDDLKIIIFDVGQGDSILVKYKDKNFLIDTGDKDNFRKVDEFLSVLNIKNIDYLILTHPHDDHIYNSPYILKKIGVRKIIMNKDTLKNPICKFIQTNYKNKLIYLEYINYIRIDNNFKILKLHPNDNYTSTNINNYSGSFIFLYNNFSFLTCGDIEKDVEEFLNNDIKTIFKNYNIKHINLYKVNHHGSDTSSTKEFLKLINPDISVVSVGLKNKFYHPSDKTIENLKSYSKIIKRTDINKSVIITTNGKRILISK